MGVIVEWLGHACFRLSEDGGKSILIDPYDDTIGYRIPDYSCDILLISHDHFDHAAEQFVPTEHVTVRTEGIHDAGGITIEARTFPHDESGGSKRGHVLAFWGFRGCSLTGRDVFPSRHRRSYDTRGRSFYY